MKKLTWALLDGNTNIVLVPGIAIDTVALVVTLLVNDGADISKSGAGSVASRATSKHLVRSAFSYIGNERKKQIERSSTDLVTFV